MYIYCLPLSYRGYYCPGWQGFPFLSSDSRPLLIKKKPDGFLKILNWPLICNFNGKPKINIYILKKISMLCIYIVSCVKFSVKIDFQGTIWVVDRGVAFGTKYMSCWGLWAFGSYALQIILFDKHSFYEHFNFEYILFIVQSDRWCCPRIEFTKCVFYLIDLLDPIFTLYPPEVQHTHLCPFSFSNMVK